MTSTPAALLPVALDAVALASDIVRTQQPGTVTVKSDRDMATDVDYAVERAVRKFLRNKTPDIGFLGEEEGSTGPADDELLWVLDPVDGTANFLRGLPLCAISLGLAHGPRPVLGVIDLPFLGHRYHAAEGHGAYRDGQPIRASRTKDMASAIVAIGDYAVGPHAEQRNERRLALTARLASKAQRVRMLGSAALDLAWVTDGHLDAAVMLANKPWDTTAGVLLAREAGARVVDLDGAEHTLNATATIAAPLAIVDQVLALISESASSLNVSAICC